MRLATITCATTVSEGTHTLRERTPIGIARGSSPELCNITQYSCAWRMLQRSPGHCITRPATVASVARCSRQSCTLRCSLKSAPYRHVRTKVHTPVKGSAACTLNQQGTRRYLPHHHCILSKPHVSPPDTTPPTLPTPADAPGGHHWPSLGSLTPASCRHPTSAPPNYPPLACEGSIINRHSVPSLLHPVTTPHRPPHSPTPNPCYRPLACERVVVRRHCFQHQAAVIE